MKTGFNYYPREKRIFFQSVGNFDKFIASVLRSLKSLHTKKFELISLHRHTSLSSTIFYESGKKNWEKIK